jgi:hypothetical protein
MSYAELAEARRIAMSSAIRLVMRRGWRRQKDNHGTTRALVPPEWLEPARSRHFEPDPQLTEAIGALQMSVAALRERAEAAERAARFERERAERAEQARNADLSRNNLLRDRIDVLRSELAEAQAALELARAEAIQVAQTAYVFQQADATWRQLGRLARIWRVWRGG